MNERPWPAYPQVNPVDASSGPTGIEQLAASLNAMVGQFNQMATILGGLEQQMTWMRDQILKAWEAINGVQATVPALFTGENDQGYITNEVLKNWPAETWFVGNPAGTPLLTVNPTAEDPYVEVSAAAGPGYVNSAAVYLDEDGNYGIAIDGDNLQLGAVGGVVYSYQLINSLTGFAVNTDVGASAVTGGATFVGGLYISGDIQGGIAETAEDDKFYLRFHATGQSALWYDLTTFLPGLTLDTAWAGSTSLVTLGTVGTGTWEGTAIEDAYIDSAATWNAMIPLSLGTAAGQLIYFSAEATAAALTPGGASGVLAWNAATTAWAVGLVSLAQMATMTANSLLGNNTGDAATPAALSVAQVQTLLGLTYVPNLGGESAWTGSTSIATLGSVTTCAAFTCQGTVQATGFKGATLRPVSDGVAAVKVTNVAGTPVMTYDTTNKICYPNRIVIPT